MQITSSSQVTSPKLPQQFRQKDNRIINISEVQEQTKKYAHHQEKFFNQSIQCKSSLNFMDNINSNLDAFQLTFPSDFMNEQEFQYHMRAANEEQYVNSEKKSQRTQRSVNSNASYNFIGKTNNVTRELSSGSNQTSFNKIQEISFNANKKGLSKFPQVYTFRDEDLEYLDLSNNKFREIPKEVFRFKKLKVFKMDSNFIKEIPEILFNCLNLEILSLSNNLISQIPETISLQKNLKYLDISLNRVGSICNFGIGNLQELITLIINNNEFRFIPTQIKDLKNLQNFTLDWFKYAQPPLESCQKSKDVLRKLGQLCELEYNKILQTENVIFDQDYSKNENFQNDQGVYFLDFVQHFSWVKEFNLSIKDKQNNTLAHLAAQDEDLGALSSILSEDYNQINQLNSESHTPLSLSIISEKYFASRLLVGLGANVNMGGGIYGSCLNLAMIKFQSIQVQDILKRGGNPNQKDKDGNISLHYLMTIYNRDPKFAEKMATLLLRNGADPNIKNNEGYSPIHIAVRKSCHEALLFILNHNKSIKQGKYYDQSGDSMVKTSVKQFNINRRGGKDLKQNIKIYIYLNINNIISTPLHIATQDQNQDMISTLLWSHQCDIFIQNRQGKVAIDLCMRDSAIYKIIKIYHDLVVKKMYEEEFQLQKQQIREQLRGLSSRKEPEENHADTSTTKFYDGLSKRTGVYQISGEISLLDVDGEADESMQQSDFDEYKLQDEKDLNHFNIAQRSLNYGQNNLKQIETYFQCSMKRPLETKNSNIQNKSVIIFEEQGVRSSQNGKGENNMSYQDYCKMKHQIQKLEQMIQFFQINMKLFINQINNQNEILSERLKFVFFMFKMYQDISHSHLKLQNDKMKVMEYHIDLYDQDILRFEKQFLFFQDSVNEFYRGLKQIIDFQLLAPKEIIVYPILDQVIYFLGVSQDENSLDHLRAFYRVLPNYLRLEALNSIILIKSKLYKKPFNNYRAAKSVQERFLINNNVSEPSLENYSIRSVDDEESLHSFRSFHSTNNSKVYASKQSTHRRDYQVEQIVIEENEQPPNEDEGEKQEFHMNQPRKENSQQRRIF